jgi:ribosomal protein S18 acetylase RimI-like enzyme
MAQPSHLPHAIPRSARAGQKKSIILPQQDPKVLRPVVFEKRVVIRHYTEKDFEEVSNIYKIAFAESPWNEYKKCASCGVKYTQKDVGAISLPVNCKKCQVPLSLRDFWSDEEIRRDLSFSLSQPFPVNLVAENGNGLVGMIWGCLIPLDHFAFLKDHILSETHYLDDIAVRQDRRMCGIGTQLGLQYLEEVKKMGISEIILRTDERNVASMALFKKLGFSPLYADNQLLRDPNHFHRIYLKKDNM